MHAQPEQRTQHEPAVAILAGLVLAAFAGGGVGAGPEIRFARQFSMGYLQFNVMEQHQLLEKHAKALGIPEIKVAWATFNSPAAMNDALLSARSTSSPAACRACSRSGRARRARRTR